MWFIVKRRGCCYNLSSGVAVIVWFTTNGMCTKNNNICTWCIQAIQMNPVNRMANLPSFFMRLIGICDYPCQTKIYSFPPYSTSVHMLATWHRWCYSLTPNAEISRTVGYKSASRCSKNPLLLIQYFKFWNPSVFNKLTVISWNVNSKLLQARTLHAVLTLWEPAYDIFVLGFQPKQQQFSVALLTP